MLANKIGNVVKEGTRSVPVIKLHLDNFVKTNFSAATMPDRDNVMFYPSDKTIYNHMYNAILKMKKTTIDQDALQMKVSEWKKELSGGNIHFRPCAEVDGEVQPLLFCYQTAWQVELLRKYGTVCLLDATYKTTKYDIPLFFITVKTNVCYLVVGFFYVQVEDTQSICEALNIFKEWNVDMSPGYWVTDFSESEINAIQAVFPCSKVYLCSFHREQAWNRWLREHVKEQEDRETIVYQWRRVAASSSLQQYKDNLEKMKNHHVFEGKESALKYFEKQWVPVYHSWVKAFEHKGMFTNINTTNGAEAMNRLKYSHLHQSTDTTLTGVITVLVHSYLPSLIEKYCKLNYAIKSYNKMIPVFLHRKTPDFTRHVMKRYESVKVDFSAESVTMVTMGLFHVKCAGNKGSHYTVNFKKPDCSCPDFQKFKYPCKHFCAIFHFSEWGFHKLNFSYRTSPLICLDETYGFGSRSSCSTETSTETNDLQDTSQSHETNEQHIPETSNGNAAVHQRVWS
ncbi:uncharacterized protein LOC126262984 isoform X2 [Schistocerca nitens]|uniref:uncharacterized protein LOC126262984 isoform X2 n=1 Tax=Schistocerca nitens TaxID=7011 RepID=UPI0021195847|nr:uncharacterized protein LOC126262984 isoform X2 [Schistocerca nitens]